MPSLDVVPPLDVVMVGPFPADATRIEGGVQASLYGLAVALRDHPGIGPVRVVATPNRPADGLRRAEIDGIDVIFLDTPARFQVSAVLRLPAVFAEIRRARRPVVHLHGTGLVQSAVLIAARLRRIPVVWTMHGITEKEMTEARRREPGFKAWARWLLYTGCERLQLRLSPHIVVDTPYVAAAIADHARATPQVVPQGIFPDEIAAARNPARHAPRAVALGVVHPRKGHLLTVKAFAAVLRDVPDARLTIVGSLADPAHHDEIRRTIAALGLDGAVDLLVDQPRGRVLEILREARVFVLHSQEESQGIALCEAMAAGLPIVATRVGGIPDVIGDSRAGFLVDYGDTDSMALRIVRLFRDDALFAATAAAAEVRAGDFAWASIAIRIAAIYGEAVAGL